MATGGARGVRSGQDRGAAGKVPKEAVIRVFVILLDILIVVLLEKTTRKTSRNSGLPPSQTDKSARHAGSNGKGPKPNRQMGDNLRKTIVEETVAACDACGADGPVDRERRTTSCSRSCCVDAEECPKCKARFPDNIPCSTASKPSSLLVAQMLSLRRRARAGDLRHQALRGLGHAFTMRHGRRPPWRTSCNARCRRFRINGKWLYVVGTCKFPHRKRGQEIGPCYKGVLGLVHGSVATSCAAATCCAN